MTEVEFGVPRTRLPPSVVAESHELLWLVCPDFISYQVSYLRVLSMSSLQNCLCQSDLTATRR